jgi:hypothetical protein
MKTPIQRWTASCDANGFGALTAHPTSKRTRGAAQSTALRSPAARIADASYFFFASKNGMKQNAVTIPPICPQWATFVNPIV